MFASVDVNYCFRYIDVGTNGRANDASVFAKSSLNATLEANMLNFLNNGIFVADDAFPLRTYILKPYGRSINLSRKQKIFNYRLSRARRIVENGFAILTSRFRVFETPIAVSIDKVDIIIKSTCALHNWLRITFGERYTPPGFVDTEDINTGCITPGSWRQIDRMNVLRSLNISLGSHNYTREASNVRNEYAEYFSGRGAVPWQLNMIHDD